MEAQQARDARGEVFIKRDDRSERLARCGIAEPQPMLAGCVGDNYMATVNPGQVGENCPERARIDRRGGLKSLRCCVENDCDGGQLRTPDNRL